MTECSLPSDEGAGAVPPGKLRVKVTFLEMRQAPQPGGTAVSRPQTMRIERVGSPGPTIAFYRFLYGTVGAPWSWFMRRDWPDQRIAAAVQHPEVDVHVLYVDGQPAGFAELDRRQTGQVELVYFGLMPQFIGRGLGPCLLHHAIHAAWTFQPERLWLHTCTLDHPSAQRTYQKAGFTSYDEVWHVIDDPRALGFIRPDAADLAGKAGPAP